VPERRLAYKAKLLNPRRNTETREEWWAYDRGGGGGGQGNGALVDKRWGGWFAKRSRVEQDMPPWPRHRRYHGRRLGKIPSGQDRALHSWVRHSGRLVISASTLVSRLVSGINKGRADLTASDSNHNWEKCGVLARFVVIRMSIWLRSRLSWASSGNATARSAARSRAELFSHRYGDCKDKVTLLRSDAQGNRHRILLRAINTERGYGHAAHGLPNLAFDHAILAHCAACRSRDGTLCRRASRVRNSENLFFDPTMRSPRLAGYRSAGRPTLEGW